MSWKSDFLNAVLKIPVSSVIMNILALGVMSTHSPSSGLLQDLGTSLLCPVSARMVAVKLEVT